MRLPSAWIVAGTAACLGTALGGGIPMFEASLRPWRAGDFSPAATQPTGPVPTVDVPETQFAFGTVGVGATGFHEFVIRNTGEAVLELTRGATSCTCTVSDFEQSEGGSSNAKVVPPGGSTKLKVQWRGKGDGGPFRQQAGVMTNDPRRPQVAFVVEGTVVPKFKTVPSVIALTKISAGTGEQVSVKIFTFGTQQPTVDSLTATDEKTAQLYSLSSAPLEASEVAAEKGASGGIEVTADILPGLPIGPLRQTIRVVLRIPDEVTAEIPVEGSVSGDLALAGKAWDSSHEVLSLGTVSSRTGAQTTIFVTAKGPYREDLRLVVRDVVPETLKVIVEEGKPVGSGNVIRIPLSITISPGSAPSNHICSPQAPAGKIVLETAHPDSPTLTIPVCVAIVP